MHQSCINKIQVILPFSGIQIKIGKLLTCETENIIYMVEYQKENCGKQYIGKTKRSIKERFSDHTNYVRNYHLNQATGAHFN